MKGYFLIKTEDIENRISLRCEQQLRNAFSTLARYKFQAHDIISAFFL